MQRGGGESVASIIQFLLMMTIIKIRSKASGLVVSPSLQFQVWFKEAFLAQKFNQPG